MSKGIIFTLAFLLAVVSVSASYLPVSDIIFEYKGVECDTNGTITINVTHEGASLRYGDIKLTAHSDAIAPIDMIGKWYIGSHPASNYEAPLANFTGSD